MKRALGQVNPPGCRRQWSKVAAGIYSSLVFSLLASPASAPVSPVIRAEKGNRSWR